MHFHLPKPLHGWREFVGEVGIIVVGVLIALSADSAIERWRWQEKVHASQEAFRDELAAAGMNAYERLAIQACLQTRIRDLSNELVQTKGAWLASPLDIKSNQYLNVMPVAYRAPSRVFRMDGWHNATANGALDHIPQERVRELSEIYSQLAQFDASQEKEAEAAAALTPLAFDVQLDAHSRVEMLAALGQVDRVNSLMALQAGQLIEAIRAMHFGIPRADVRKAQDANLNAQRAARGACVSRPPLDLG